MTTPGMQEAMGRDVPRAIAHEYVGAAEQIIAQALGRPPEVGEIADFAEIASATLMAGMYDILRRQKSPEEAETWLKKTLALMCSHVRFRGSDALIKAQVTIKDVPNNLAKRRPEAVQQEYGQTIVPTPTCDCKVDGAGRCAPCAEKLAVYFRSVFEPFRQMAAAAKDIREVCKVCQPAQVDYAMSSVVPILHAFDKEMGKDGKPSKIGEEMLVVCYQLASAMGVQEMPLTEKAWQDAMAQAPSPGDASGSE